MFNLKQKNVSFITEPRDSCEDSTTLLLLILSTVSRSHNILIAIRI